jgi:hypothetical protein
MHPPNPRPEATVCAVTRGNIAELAATAFIALLVVFAVASNNGIQRRTVQWRKNHPPNPRRKTYSLREELAQHRGILRWFCGRFEQSDTGESCGVAWRRGSQSIPIERQIIFDFPRPKPTTLSHGRKRDFAFDKSPSRPMARHRQWHQSTSERQTAVAALSLIAVQSRNLMVAHPDSGPALQFPSAVDVMKEP